MRSWPQSSFPAIHAPTPGSGATGHGKSVSFGSQWIDSQVQGPSTGGRGDFMTAAPPPSTSVPDQPKPVRRWRRRAVVALLILTVMVAVTTAAAPTLLSTNPGKRLLVAVVDRQIEGAVKIDAVSLSWFAGQSVRGLTFRDADQRTTVTVGDLKTEATLWGLLWGNYDLGRTSVRDVEAFIDTGETSSRAGAAGPASEPLQLPRTLALEGVLTNATVSVRRPGAMPVILEQLEAEVSIASLSKPMTFRYSGRSRHDQLSGAFSGSGELRDVFDASRRIQAARARAQLEMTTTDLPADAVDGLLGLDGQASVAAAASSLLSWHMRYGRGHGRRRDDEPSHRRRSSRRSRSRGRDHRPFPRL